MTTIELKEKLFAPRNAEMKAEGMDGYTADELAFELYDSNGNPISYPAYDVRNGQLIGEMDVIQLINIYHEVNAASIVLRIGDTDTIYTANGVENQYNTGRDYSLYDEIFDLANIAFVVRDRECGNPISTVSTYKEAVLLIKHYENDDKKDGNYTPNFYEITAKEINA